MAARFPDRFFNVGVAEQNMLGLATGLAEAGLIPYVYSIVTFDWLGWAVVWSMGITGYPISGWRTSAL